MAKVLITTSSFGVWDPSVLVPLEGAGYAPVLNPHGRKLTEDEAVEFFSANDPVGVIAGVEPLTRRVMESAPSLRAIARCGIGMDSVDLDAAADLGIAVSRTPDAPTMSVAEITLGAILCHLRGIHNSCESIRSGGWGRPMGGLLSARTVGLIGLGRIGSRLASLLAPFGCRIVGFDPYADAPDNVESVSLDTLYAEADVVSLHIPYIDETRNFIDAGALAKMRPGALLVNYSRGGLVDEDALLAAIEEGRIAGAALDCFASEPYAGPLAKRPEVLLTGHIGSYAREGRAAQEMQSVENLLADLGTASAR